MTTETKPRLKITYATLRNDNEELHAQFDSGVEKAKALLGVHHRNIVGGREREGLHRRSGSHPIAMSTSASSSRSDKMG